MSGEIDEPSLDPISDDDAISVTSTVQSEKQLDYELDGILAERRGDEGMEYLTKWTGYDDWENTWEPEKNLMRETKDDWRDQKMRISRGLEKPFDVAAWERACLLHERTTLERKERRRRKRIELGLPVIDLLESDEESSDWEPPMEIASPVWTSREESTLLDALQRLGGPQWNRVVELHGSSGTINQDLKQRTEAGLLRKAVILKRDFDASGKGFPIELETSINPNADTGKGGHRRSSDSEVAQIGRGGAQNKASMPRDAKGKTINSQARTQATPGKRKDSDRLGFEQGKNSHRPNLSMAPPTENISGPTSAPAAPGANASPTVSSNLKSASPHIPRGPGLLSAKAQQRPTQTGAVGRGPARVGTTSSASNAGPAINVMAKNWAAIPAKRRKSKYDLSQGRPEAEKKASGMFKKFSERRKSELAGRFEHTPDINSLTFVNRKDGKPISKQKEPKPPHPEEKTPFQILQERNEDQNDTPTLTQASGTVPEDGTAHPLLPDGLARRASAINQPVSVSAASIAPTAPARRASIPFETYSRRTVSTEKPFAAPKALMSIDEQQRKPAGSLRDSTIPETSADILPDRQSLRTFSESMGASDNQDKWLSEAGTSALPKRVTARRLSQLQTERLQTRTPNSTAEEAKLPVPFLPRAPRYFDAREDGYSLFPETDISFSHEMDPHMERSSTDVLAEILTGVEGHSTGNVVFRGLADHDLKNTFLSIRKPPKQMHVWCNLMCTAGEYAITFHNPEAYLGSGWIAPNRESFNNLRQTSTVLLEHASGALFFAEYFTLLIYPVGCVGWQYLDDGFPKPPSNARLRFAMLVPMPRIRERISERGVRTQRITRSIDCKERSLNVVVKSQFGMDFSRFIAQSVDKDGSKGGPLQFFLIYPPAAREERDLIADWIRANNSTAIYRYEDRVEKDIFQNDLILSMWFAGWAMLKQEKFRRFPIITGRSEDSEQQRKLKDELKKYNHIAVYSFEEFVKAHKVWDWPKLQEEDEKRIKRAKEAEMERSGPEADPADLQRGDTEMKDAEAAEESLFLPMGSN
ncbi:MAG: hypothetical protein Q9220_002986 [cf. Caloplaca sp. 1 TL-2023]